MKCPKCGFNSFEYYNSCKKCSSDLSGYKQTYSITSMVLPLEAKEELLKAESASAESASNLDSVTSETHDDMFSFDLPGNTPAAPAFHNDDPFNFDEPSAEVQQSSDAKSEGDVFADLLESTAQVEKSPFADEQGDAFNAPAAAKSEHASSEPGEFNLDSFSWDDATTETPAPDSETPDNFDSLFGATKENSSK